MRLPCRTTRPSPSNSRCSIYDLITYHDESVPLRYAVEIAQQLLDRAQDNAARQTCQTHVDVHQMLVPMAEGDLEEPRAGLSLYVTMVADTETNQGIGLMDKFLNAEDSIVF
jgi:hypothetical protein